MTGFGGYMWGAYLTTIYRSSDGGATWSTYWLLVAALFAVAVLLGWGAQR